MQLLDYLSLMEYTLFVFLWENGASTFWLPCGSKGKTSIRNSNKQKKDESDILIIWDNSLGMLSKSITNICFMWPTLRLLLKEIG